MAKRNQLLADLKAVRAAVAAGSTFSAEMHTMVKNWPRERGIAVCNAFDAVEEDLAILDAAIETQRTR